MKALGGFRKPESAGGWNWEISAKGRPLPEVEKRCRGRRNLKEGAADMVLRLKYLCIWL